MPVQIGQRSVYSKIFIYNSMDVCLCCIVVICYSHKNTIQTQDNCIALKKDSISNGDIMFVF